jgi:hypothetical protein
LLFGLFTAFLLQSATLVGEVAAQCADPRGNSYCSNDGQVTFSAPPSGSAPAQSNTAPAAPQSQPTQSSAPPAQSPAIQSNTPASGTASLSIDPPSAPAGATVSITAQGLGGGRSAWVNLSHTQSTGGLNLGAKQLATVNTAPDGSLSTSVVIPTVPSWTAGPLISA